MLDPDAAPVEQDGRAWPGAYFRLALDNSSRFGHKPAGWDSWGSYQATRYVRKLQSRRSLLTWKIFGRRLDGFSNDDHPSESKPGAGDLVQNGEPLDVQRFRARFDVDFVGSPMPPPAAVKAGKVQPLSDEDRRTIARWIDLGCPIDLDYDPAAPDRRGYGWMCDENRPTLAVTYPRASENDRVDRILVGMHDYYSGLDLDSFTATADFDVNGTPAGQNLGPQFRKVGDGVYELKLEPAIDSPGGRSISVSVTDRQGNISRIDRAFSVGDKQS